MMELRQIGPELLGVLRRTLAEPGLLEIGPEELRRAMSELPPEELKKLLGWHHCLQPSPEYDRFLASMGRMFEGRAYRRSVLLKCAQARRVAFGDGLNLIFMADHPTAESFLSRFLPGTKLHEPELVAYLKRTVRRGDMIVDLGAHVGYVSCIAAALGAAVLAVEMQPTLIPIIQRNAELNDLWRVHTLCAAVGDRTGLVPSLRNSPSPGSRAALGQWERGKFPLTSVNHDLIPLLTLDSLFAGGPYPTLVKVDVEGAEARVLAGAAQTIAAAQTRFMVEVHAHQLKLFGDNLAGIASRFPAESWTLAMLTAQGVEPLSRDRFLDPEGPVARHAHNAAVLFEPVTR